MGAFFVMSDARRPVSAPTLTAANGTSVHTRKQGCITAGAAQSGTPI